MKQWFVVHVQSGKEDKVVTLIRQALASYDKEVGEIIVPTKKISKLGKSGKISVEKKLYPGYIIAQMEPNDELFKIISQTAGVLSFINKGKAPQLISEEEEKQMFGYIKPEEGGAIEVPFVKGDSVRIIDGPFADFSGTVEEVYPDKERIKLLVTVFGRQTPVEVAFFQIEPI